MCGSNRTAPSVHAGEYLITPEAARVLAATQLNSYPLNK